jgi:hypothetical protein
MRSSSEAALCENDDGAAIKTMIKEKKNLLRISTLQLMKQKSLRSSGPTSRPLETAAG